MVRRVAGVLADLRGPAIAPLRNTLPANPMLGDAGRAERLCTIHLIAGGGGAVGGEQSRRLSVVRNIAGEFILIEASGENAGAPRRAQLKREEFAALWDSWGCYRGAIEGTEPTPEATMADAAPPLIAGRFRCDKSFLSERFNGGHGWTIDAARRTLDDSSFIVRVPKGYDPKSPAGLLVWVSPTESGAPPKAWGPALDALGFIAIGANQSGNNRHITDRYQLALDGAQFVRERYHIDPRRVYVSGFSGGGRTSSMLWACVPDVFAGAVPIGGVSCYEVVPNGLGQFWPAGYQKPAEKLWALSRAHRMAPITGSKDFNQREVQNAVAIFERSRLPVKLWDVKDLAHEIPSATVLREALGWIDEPYHATRAHEEEEAGKLVAQARKRASIDDQARVLLRKATEVGPWTPAAWEAIELLRGEGAKAGSTP